MPASPKSFNTGRQLEIYSSRHLPTPTSIPFDAEELREKARRAVEVKAWNFVDGGAGGEDTLRANLDAFRRWRIVPRMLQDVSQRDMSIELLGTRLRHPILIAPIGVQGDFHPEGDLATARGAAATGTPMILSGVSSFPMEDVAAAMDEVDPAVPRWFQLYWPKTDELTQSFLSRAEVSGYSAIVVTLDTQTMGWRPRDLAAPHLPFLNASGLGNYLSDPVFRRSLPVPPEEDIRPAVEQYLEVFSNPGHTWDHLRFLRENTRLPILIKGIQHPDDARRCLDFGADGVMVSNHGGRQVDGAIGSLDALVPIVDAIGGQCPVFFDSGIRRGSDVFKALALGASAVLIGRPYMWGLAIGGADGVRDVLLNLLAEFDLTLALTAKRSPSQIDRSDLWEQTYGP